MKSIRCFFFLFVLSLVFSVEAQERHPINVFNTEDYGGESQNWSISQSEALNIYVANNKGLLEYNGAEWSLYKSPIETIMRSVKVIDSLIYTGSYQNFGFWKKDNYGVLNYTSLSEELNVEFLEGEEFWNIEPSDNSILFQSLDRIHIYNKSTKAYNVVNSKTTISRLFRVDSNFYFQSLNNGLYKIEKGESILVSDSAILNTNVIVNMYNLNNVTLILTQDNGFYQLDNKNIIPWKIQADNTLADVSVFSSIQLKDKSFVLGTISDGIIYLTTKMAK